MSNAFIIDGMEWSYQRLSQFEDCKYAWYLKYILHRKSNDPKFFASYGTFMHKVLELRLNGDLPPDQVVDYFLDNYDTEVRGAAPSEKVARGFFEKSLAYLRDFNFPFEDIVETEKEVHFHVDGRNFVGYIDVLAREDNELHIIDHKSHGLRNRSGRVTPTSYDAELDQYLRQQYLYSIPIFEEFGKYPATINFNCYRFNRMVTEPFDVGRLEATKEWAAELIKEIRDEELWEPSPEFFKCQNLCDCAKYCEYCPKKRR